MKDGYANDQVKIDNEIEHLIHARQFQPALSLFEEAEFDGLGVRRNKYKKTLRICDAALLRGLWNQNLAETKSVCLIILGRYPEAVDFTSNQLQTYPDSALLHLNLSRAYKMIGKRRESKAEYALALGLDPNLESMVKKKRRKNALFASFLTAYLLLGILFLPGSKYFLIPLWLFLIALLIWSLPRIFKSGHIENFLLIIMALVSAAFLFNEFFFNANSYSSAHNRLAVIIVAGGLGLFLLIGLGLRARRS